MAYAVWIVLLASVFSFAEEVQWTELRIEELSSHDDNKRVVIARGVIRNEFAIRLKCPKPFVIYPRNDNEAAAADPHVFVEAGGSFVEIPLSKVLHSLYENPIVTSIDDHERSGMQLRYPGVSHANYTLIPIIRKYATHIHFICATPYTTFHHDLMSKLRYLKVGKDNPNSISVKEGIVKHLREQGTAIGMISIDISNLRNVTHGCGSKDTPYFLNEVEYDEETNVRSCTIDVMKHPDVGFYCDGTVVPEGCLRYMLDSKTSRIIKPGFFDICDAFPEQHLHLANYDRRYMKFEFSGYCKCIDDKTGLVNARITVKTGVTHECDFPALMFKHLTQPILGNWCDVGMLPGSTLTIKVPVNVHYDMPGELSDSEIQERKSLLMTSYINPEDMRTHFFNYEELDTEIYPSRLYENDRYILGDALQIDQSRKNEGIITVTYLEDRPLSYPPRITGLSYTLTMNFTKGLFHINDVQAIINLVPVVTHDYYMNGCEPPSLSIFPFNGYNTKKRDMDIYGLKVRICKADVSPGIYIALYCPPEQSMEPDNCGKYGFGASLQTLETWKYDVEVKRNKLVSNMLITTEPQDNRDSNFSRSCSCVDNSGVETARMILSNYTPKPVMYTGFGLIRKKAMIVPVANIIEEALASGIRRLEI